MRFSLSIYNKKASGNSLMEYAVPLAIIVVTAGVLATVLDINQLMGNYFMAASGHGAGAKQGSTFKPSAIASTASGSVGNGAGGFSNLGTLTDGSGGTIAAGSGSSYASSANSVAGGAGNNQLLGTYGSVPALVYAAETGQDGANGQYTALMGNVAALSATQSTDNGTAGQTMSVTEINYNNAALQAGIQAAVMYGTANIGEVIANGGLDGMQQIVGMIDTSGMNNAQSNAWLQMAQNDGFAIDDAIEQFQRSTVEGVEINGINASDIPEIIGENTGGEISALGAGALLIEKLFPNLDLTSIYGQLMLTTMFGSNGSGMLLNPTDTNTLALYDAMGHLEGLNNEYGTAIAAEEAAAAEAEAAAAEAEAAAACAAGTSPGPCP